ncbi:MAG: tyrosine-type recombinase/integrase [Anaerolineales bacterium]|nr:tyrosine-type recombinase/integrase [Anaerolineales bacterium]
METEVNAFLSKIEADAAFSESTQLAYANDMRVFLHYLDTLEDHPPELDDLNSELVVNFLETERKLGRRRNTLVRRLATLTYFQEFLVTSGSLGSNQFTGNDQIIQRVISQMPENRSPQCLNERQVKTILTILESSSRPRALRDRAIFVLLLETGLSVASLTALDMTDIDLASNRIHVHLAWVGDVWLGMNKAHGPLGDYIAAGRPNLLDKPGEPALFISQMDGRLSRQGVWQILQFWGSQAEPAIHLSPRIVRHSAALRMNKAGMSSRDIQKRLGHRNVLSTQALIRRLEANC